MQNPILHKTLADKLMELPKDVRDALEANQFMLPTVIDGVVVALQDFYTTRGICVGINEFCTTRRYCYQDRTEALMAYAVWVEAGDHDAHPPGNWIKLKGTYRGQHVDELNPNWSRS